MNKIKKFTKLLSFEFTRLYRNKLMISLLLLFSIILLSVVVIGGNSSNGFINAKIALYTDGKSIDDIHAVSFIKDNYSMDNIIIVDSIQEGIDAVKYDEAIFFLEVNSESTPETLVMHYDGYSNASNRIRESLNEEKNQYSYDVLSEFLYDCGITINQAYFDILSFQPVNGSDGWGISTSYVTSVAAGLSIVVLLGLAYSISRDNETNVNKILSYMPINSHTYLWVKIATYMIIGLFELLFLLLIGLLFFKINFQLNILLIIAISMCFLLATSCMGLIFSSCRSQVVTAILSMMVILIPIFLISMFVFQGIAIPLKIFLMTMPIAPYIQLLHGMIFNGVINWLYVFIMLIEVICYYLIAYLLLSKKTKRKKTSN